MDDAQPSGLRDHEHDGQTAGETLPAVNSPTVGARGRVRNLTRDWRTEY